MATLEVAFLHSQLEVRKRRLETAITLAPQKAGFVGLLREVDSALERMAKGSYGLCQECHETIEQDRLLADPLVRYCLDHLTSHNEPRCNVTSIWPPRCSATFCHK
jgi:phosphoserine phosphatase RsbU/P